MVSLVLLFLSFIWIVCRVWSSGYSDSGLLFKTAVKSIISGLGSEGQGSSTLAHSDKQIHTGDQEQAVFKGLTVEGTDSPKCGTPVVFLTLLWKNINSFKNKEWFADQSQGNTYMFWINCEPFAPLAAERTGFQSLFTERNDAQSWEQSLVQGK